VIAALMTWFGIGRSVWRIEDARFLRGRGRFVDDIHLPHQSFGVVLMSPHAHARIKSVDATEAKVANGVICVLTGGDLIADKLGCLPPLFMPEDYGGPKGYRTCRPLLVTEHVRCVGDRVAFVVAETLAQAQTAAELIHVHYEPLPAVIGLESAIQEDAPRIWQDCPTGNVSFELTFGDQRATDAAFAAAKHVVSLRLRNNRVSANPLEPRAAIGCYEPASDSYTLYTTTQNPHGVRSLVAGTALKIPESKLRVVGPDVGGGFGLKTNPHVEDALVLWASRRCGRPVKWVATRSDSLVGDYQARDQIVHGEMALDQDGRILGIRARALHALGAYTAAVCAVPISCAMQFIPNVYDVKAVDLRTRAVFTNTAAVTAYRGTGRPEANYLVERLIDEAAIKIGLDPAEIRRRNLITPSAMPYMTATGITYDSGEFALVLDKCLKIADWAGFSKRRSASEKNGQLRGRSVTCYIETAGYANERMEIRFDPDGTVTIVAGTHSHGQGHATTYAQMVAEWLGVSFETIRFIQGDTDKVPFGRGTYAARSSMNGGNALKAAADGIIAKARLMAAAMLEADPADIAYQAGQFRVQGTDRTLALVEVARSFFQAGGVTDQFGLGLEASGSYGTNAANYPNGCHVCEIEIDPETGLASVAQYTVVDDAGRVINPLICEGQVHGGLAQGIGQAMLEQIVYDGDSGQIVSASFMDYAMPRAIHLPNFVTEFVEVPCTTNPLGVKGIGEAGTIATPPAIINALLDALRPLGVTHIDMPATPANVWNAIRRGRPYPALAKGVSEITREHDTRFV
jgi:aerobic carbon-monoxide dehydrogenase large subunit